MKSLTSVNFSYPTIILQTLAYPSLLPFRSCENEQPNDFLQQCTAKCSILLQHRKHAGDGDFQIGKHKAIERVVCLGITEFLILYTSFDCTALQCTVVKKVYIL
jgi:hypothetical protein